MSWFDAPANHAPVHPKAAHAENFEMLFHAPTKTRTTPGFVPFPAKGERTGFLDLKAALFHASEDDADYHSNYKDDSVAPPRRLRPSDPGLGEHSRSVNPSLKLINNDFMRSKDGPECHVPFENDPGSICYLESDNDFVPDFEPESNTLNFVFNPNQDESMLNDSALLLKIQQLTKGRAAHLPDAPRAPAPEKIEIFQVLRPSRKLLHRPSVYELQEKIEKMNQSRERSRQLSEAVEDSVARQPLDQDKPLAAPQEEGVRAAAATGKEGLTPPNTPTNFAAMGVSVASGGQPAEPLACRCKKTNCLKLYCECFLKGGMCGPQCKCVGCMNTTAHQTIREMLLEDHYNKGAIAYNPSKQAVDDKVATVIQRDRRCTCGKTGCNKKYCECFRNNSRCTADCKCKGCKNGNEGRPDDDSGRLGARKQIKKRRSNFLNSLIEKMKICSLAKNGSGRKDEGQ